MTTPDRSTAHSTDADTDANVDPVSDSPEPSDAGTAGAGSSVHPHRWAALVVVLVASFMQLLDGTITNLAIPRIQRDLHATDAQLQLVLAGYLVGYASLLVTGGRIGDMTGRRRTFGIGMVGFLVASALCACAQTGAQLDLARIVQGLAASLMLPQVLAIMQVLFPISDAGARAKAFAMYGLVLGLPTILGPFVGGAVLDANIAGLGWRPIFLINVPIGLVVLALLPRLVPESTSPAASRLDLVGVVLAAAGLVLVVGVVVQGRQLGWPTWTWIALAVGVVVLIAFARWEAVLTAARRSPVLPATLFGDRAFTVGILAALLVFAGFTPLVFFFSLYLQFGAGYTPLGAGIAIVPFAVGSVITSIASAVLVGRLGKRLLTAGAAVSVVGLAGLVLTVHESGVPLPHGWMISPALLVAGAGVGLLVGPLVNVVLAGTRTADAGAASGALNTVTIVAGAIGVAVFGIAFFGSGSPPSDAVAAAQHYTSAVQVTILSTIAAFVAVLLLTLLMPGRAPEPEGREQEVAEARDRK